MCFNGDEFREILENVRNSKIFKIVTLDETMPMNYRFYRITGKFEYGFEIPFFILFGVENDENNYSKISLIGVIPDVISKAELDKPEELMYICFSRAKKYPLPHERISNPPELNIPLDCVFEGIVELGDNSLKNVMVKSISLLFNKVTKIMEPAINDTLEIRKKQMDMKNEVGIFTKRSCGHCIVGIDDNDVII